MIKVTYILILSFLVSYSLFAQTDSVSNTLLEIPRDSLLEQEVDFNNSILVTSASLFEENLAETPGVVTVITKEEIDRRGFRQLGEIIATIPGFYIAQNEDEKIVTTRGLYNTTNQKYLVLRNGHRMNEGVLDRVYPFYAYSLENVKQIEFIRGGGSSLYGTGAMTAVINIVTDDTEARSLKVSTGNHGQFMLDGLYNLSNPGAKTKVSAFFRYANLEGESRFVPASEDHAANPINADILIDYIPNNIDVGFHISHDKLKIRSSFRREGYRFSWTTRGENILRENTILDPGISSINFHNDLRYLTKYKNWNFTFQHYADYAKLFDTKSVTSNTNSFPQTRQVSFVIPSLRLGGDYQALYQKNNLNLLFGVFGELRDYGRGDLQTNAADSTIMALSNTPLFPAGEEYRGALYFQGKYRLSKKWTFNLGARLDIADQFPESFNPRLAIIYQPQEAFYFKLLYARAFQAPSHLYLTTNSGTGINFTTTELASEVIDNVQLVANVKFGKKGNLRAVYFMNLMNDLIRLEQGAYQNLGQVSTQGLEVEVDYNFTKSFRLYGNYSLTLPLENLLGSNVLDSLYETRNIADGRFLYIPTHQAMFGLTYSFKDDISFNTYTSWIGEFSSPTSKNPDYQVEDILLVNATVRWQEIFRGLGAGFTVTNLFNQKYRLGEINTQPIPQAGRWWTVSLFYDFNVKR